jgi:SSS family solute:Na+ symporter
MDQWQKNQRIPTLELSNDYSDRLLVAFVAAALSSFNSSVNTTTAYFTRDIYQRRIRSAAKNRELIIASYAFTIVLVSSGFVLAYNIHSINQIWGWIMMGLGGGLAVPSLLKFYWWRYNGGGFAVGTTAGILGAISINFILPELVEWQQFIGISILSLIAAIIGTVLTKPTEDVVLKHFYQTTRPFGLWKPFKRSLDQSARTQMEHEHRNDLFALPFTLLWQVTLFLLPMQLMIHAYSDSVYASLIFMVSLLGMYWFWYRRLPANKAAVETL